MSNELLTPIDGLSNAILLAPDGLSVALEQEPQLTDLFFDQNGDWVVDTLQSLGNELHEFQKVDATLLRSAVFHLTLVGRNKQEAKTALQKIAGHLAAIPLEAFVRAVDSITSHREMGLFRATADVRQIARAVLKRSSFSRETVSYYEYPRRRTPPRVREAA